MDIDSDTVAALRAYRTTRASVALAFVRDAALVLGDLDGRTAAPSATRAGSSSRF